MKFVQTSQYNIEIGRIEQLGFEQLLQENRQSKFVIIVDENTQEHCLNYLITQFELLNNAEIIVIPSGEENKDLEICSQVWGALSAYKIARNDIIINLGGGVITDMGGFIASVFKRGLRFINIPTTLLAMVDASLGGKTGVDFQGYKNQIGVFSNPIAVFIDSNFLSTLSRKEYNNGRAEMLKHGFIASQSHWENILQTKDSFSDDLIYESIQIKHQIVNNDPFEKGERKLLNFGHTVGHALESYFLKNGKIAHGHAVAWGMAVEATISYQKQLLSQSELDELLNAIKTHFPPLAIPFNDLAPIYALMQQDKKNINNQVLCVLPKKIGQAQWDCPISFEDFQSAMTSFTK